MVKNYPGCGDCDPFGHAPIDRIHHCVDKHAFCNDPAPNECPQNNCTSRENTNAHICVTTLSQKVGCPKHPTYTCFPDVHHGAHTAQGYIYAYAVKWLQAVAQANLNGTLTGESHFRENLELSHLQNVSTMDDVRFASYCVRSFQYACLRGCEREVGMPCQNQHVVKGETLGFLRWICEWTTINRHGRLPI
jgi:hypothetical protein